MTLDTRRDPVDAWARDPKRIRAALDLLAESKASTTDDLHRYAIDNGGNPETIHLASAILAERGCRRCSGEVYGGMCPLGRELWNEVEAARDAYLDSTGADFDNVALDEWKTWQRAEARLDAHIEDRHGR